MTKRVLVTGVSGQLGRCIQDRIEQMPEFKFTFVDRQQLDLSDSDAIASFLEGKRYDCVINCAAYTAVDKAETEIELAEQVNHLAVKLMAEWAAENDCYLIHVSTDYVFDGCHYKPYSEDHPTDPINRYGLTKRMGELAIEQSRCAASIVRTSWVYSEYGNNFVKTMVKLGRQRDHLNVIFDQIGSPTYAGDLADALLLLMLKKVNGPHKPVSEFFHYSNEGVCSWYDFAINIFELSQIHCHVSPIETLEYPTPAKRPHFSLLNKRKIKDVLETNIPYWKSSLVTCLNKLKEVEHG